jgi:hypothetical protein
MKQTHLILLLLFISNWAVSQNYRGVWKGETTVADSTVVVKFNVMVQEDSVVKSMMINPVFDKFTGVNYCCDTLQLVSEKFGYEYKAVPTQDLNKLTGQFKMGTTVFPLDVSRGDPVFRPQTPQKPYPYLLEEVVFENKTDSVTLSGTLTIPNSQGSGSCRYFNQRKFASNPGYRKFSSQIIPCFGRLPDPQWHCRFALRFQGGR